jgi:uncharacterized oligopeptide transporter (OPT) family protein
MSTFFILVFVALIGFIILSQVLIRVGMLMARSNVYVVLKTGFSLVLALTSCLMAYGVFEALRRARLVSRPLGILENNAIGSAIR